MSNVSKPVKKAIKYAKPSAKLLNSRLKQEQNVKNERNKLALASVKDIFSILNPNAGSDDDFDLTDFDCKVYFASPKAFEKLPFFKKQHVIDEMNEKLKKNWKGLDKDIKRFSLWWAYGSHGPREGFYELHDYYTPYGVEIENGNKDNKDTIDDTSINEISKKSIKKTELDSIINNISKDISSESSESSRSALQMSSGEIDALQINKRPDTPPDLPFKLPSILKTFNPTKDTIIKKLPSLDPRSFGLKRLQQYRQDRRMNPVNRIVLVALVFLTVLCFKQDRRVNVTGNVPEYPWDIADREEREENERKRIEQEENNRLEELKRIQEEKEKLEMERKLNKKWYYLWLY